MPDFVLSYPFSFLILGVCNVLFGYQIVKSIFYKNISSFIKNKSPTKIAIKYENFLKNTYSDIYEKISSKLKKAGFYGISAVFIYLILIFILPLIMLISTLIFYRANILNNLFLIAAFICVIEVYVFYKKKQYTLKFNKNAYKIYKFIHNQVSSGVKPTDAVSTVFEVVDEPDIRKTLMRLAARYKLTGDLESSLCELTDRFDTHEAHTLCVALKQGVDTGDNTELLKRQEEVMFNRYFAYIQAETDSLVYKSILAAVFFTGIIIIMIALPMFKDVQDGIGRIFTN
ncbi:MAG: type II secretion system F family protein [Thermoplasmata archaeon]